MLPHVTGPPSYLPLCPLPPQSSRPGDPEPGSDSPEPPLLTALDGLLGRSDQWHFDAFQLDEATQGHPLSVLGYYLFHSTGLMRLFNIPPVTLARFLRRIESGYHCNPYHCATHAADVLQTLHVILHRGGFVPGYACPESLLSCYLSAIVHDYEHGGLNNDFLVKMSDTLAIR